jgi:hypothetical protein
MRADLLFKIDVMNVTVFKRGRGRKLDRRSNNASPIHRVVESSALKYDQILGASVQSSVFTLYDCWKVHLSQPFQQPPRLTRKYFRTRLENVC